MTPDSPSLSWSDSKLLQYLADAWGMVDGDHIRVIGRMRIAESGGFGFLEDLHDAATGIKLPPLAHISKQHQGVFVAPPDLESLGAQWGESEYVVAELTLAPLHRREERGDPLACVVRSHSMMALSRVPDSWGMKSINLEDTPIMLTMARDAIEAQLQQETVEAAQQLERTRQEHAKQLERQEGDRSEAETQLNQSLSNIQQAESVLSATREKMDTLHANFDLRRETLENKFRDLGALLHKRGERLVALDLVDRDDLNKLLPPLDKTDSREGQDYQQSLGGEFARLAPFIQARLWKKKLLFSQSQLRDFLALMRTHDLVVLAGDSGSGKTSLVRAVAESIGGRCTVMLVAV